MPGYRHRRFLSKSIQREYLDLNDRFVVRSCIEYFLRIMRVRPVGDSESLEFLCWLLGEDRTKLAAYLRYLLYGKMKEDVENEKGLLQIGNSDFVSDLDELFSKASPSQAIKFTRYAETVLQNRLYALKCKRASAIEKNLDTMRKMFNLSAPEISLCTFLFIIISFSEPENFFDNHLNLTKFEGRKYLLKALNIHHYELTKILTGKLKTTGIISTGAGRYNAIEIDDDFHYLLLNPSEGSFPKKLFVRCQKNPLPLNFHLIEKDKLEFMKGLLSRKTRTPAHILIYGPPGTGKSSFAESMTGELGLRTYKINTDMDNESLERRAAIIACMNLTNESKGSVIIIDEADNLLNTETFWFRSGETQDKGWLNQLLEKPDTRMIWITNRISEIDESVLRRFAYSHHFKPYNRSQRIRLWENVVRQNRVKRFFTGADLTGFASRYNISAGVIDLAVKKAKDVAPDSKPLMHTALKLSIESYETIMNGGKAKIDRNQTEKEFSLDGLNVSSNLQAVIDQLIKYDQYLRTPKNDSQTPMNLLLYGPPGTGKSELARYIAKEVDRNILLKRASDLLNPYVGGTEALISRAFQDAESDEAVLIIDEADTFLYNRDSAVRSWEVSFTNEFLSQMERFRGILICSTNRFDQLDQASIRRFSHKIAFDFLTPEGNVIFYQKLLSPMIKAPLSDTDKQRLLNIRDLAPGDFKTVKIKYAFYSKADLSHRIFINELKTESDVKLAQIGSNKIGFN